MRTEEIRCIHPPETLRKLVADAMAVWKEIHRAMRD
jgi:hypothetical protein